MTPHFKTIRDALEKYQELIIKHNAFDHNAPSCLAFTALSQLQKEREELVGMVERLLHNYTEYGAISEGTMSDGDALLEKMRGG